MIRAQITRRRITRAKKAFRTKKKTPRMPIASA